MVPRCLPFAKRHTWCQLALLGCLLSRSPEAAAQPPSTSEVSPPDAYELLDQLGQSLALIEGQYHQPADQAKLLAGALRGMLQELDPHSNYLDKRGFELFSGSTTGKFGGIGVEVEFSDGEIVVIAQVEGSPADRAGIRAGDQIVALDGVDLEGEKPADIVAKMRGPIGTSLRLTIRSKAKILRDVVVVREQITVSSVRQVLMKDNVGYLRIKAFQSGTHAEFLDALGALRKQSGGLSGLVLDLRNNPGGLVREASAVLNEFLSGGPLFSTRHRGRVLRERRARPGGAWTRGALVVLINEYSASASELVAGALRDRHRARLVGAQSFGKGSVQSLLSLSHGGALKLTTALYYTPAGYAVQARGIEPHVAVDPGYVMGPSVRLLKESDLAGHVGAPAAGADSKQSAVVPAAAVPKASARPAAAVPKAGVDAQRGLPPTSDDLHLGVARQVPVDPTHGPDRALEVAHRLVRGLPAAPRAPEAQAPTDAGSTP